MNCQDFNEIIYELAEDKPMQVATREAAVSHVALCADCASNLAKARNISASLRLAAGAEIEQAPIQIKQNLLAAFAELHDATTAPATVVNISNRRKLYWWTTGALAAAAALVLFAVMLPVLRKPPAPVAQQSPNATAAANSLPTSTTVQPPAPLASNTNPRLVKNRVNNKFHIARTTKKEERANQSFQSETIAQNSGQYLPLTYMSRASAMDGGTVVRVDLSRSALASLGFPLSFEGTGDPIRAEVVIGDDGVARAIRLVQ
jgi:hypothetical protein